MTSDIGGVGGFPPASLPAWTSTGGDSDEGQVVVPPMPPSVVPFISADEVPDFMEVLGLAEKSEKLAGNSAKRVRAEGEGARG